MMIKKYDVEFIIDNQNMHQSEECFILRQDSQEKKIWLHNYNEIYQYSGLYEYIFVEMFKGRSHELIPFLTLKEITNAQESIHNLVVLDFGAGVGLIGEFLKNQGVRTIVGIDLVKAAQEAVNRDRPNVYYQYYIEDLSEPSESTRSALEQMRFNCLTCVSSLNVIPSFAWRNVYNMIGNGGWIGLNIVESALSEFPNEKSLAGSNELIRQLIEQGILEVKVKKIYQHRVSAFGKPIMYVAVVGRKISDISMNLCKKYYRPIWK